MRSLLVRALAVTLGAAALAAGLTAPAQADPPAGTVPVTADIVGVGSDTTQQALNRLSAGYNLGWNANRKLYSFDALPTGTTITPKAGCDPIARPNGSSAGIAALLAGARPAGVTTDFCLDFARSSRGPRDTEDNLAFIKFAFDSVTWVSDNVTNAPLSLTIAQLKAIYECQPTARRWNQVGGTSTDNITPVLPQSQSGTRAFWLTSIGVTTPGTCVVQSETFQENNQSVVDGFRNRIVPFSVGRWSTFATPTTYVHNIEGINPRNGNPSLDTPRGTLNSAFPNTRNLYNVVRLNTTSANPIPSKLRSAFAPAPDGYVCSNGGQSRVEGEGFGRAATGGDPNVAGEGCGQRVGPV